MSNRNGSKQDEEVAPLPELNKETLRDLDIEAVNVKGGAAGGPAAAISLRANPVNPTYNPTIRADSLSFGSGGGSSA